MRPRLRLVLFLLLVVVAALVAGLIGARQNRAPSFDPRLSTRLDGPYGASAYAETLRRLGVTIEENRRRLEEIEDSPAPDGRTVFALLDPTLPLDAPHAAPLLQFLDQRGDLLLTGWNAGVAMACFGYEVDFRGDEDSVPVYRRREGGAEPVAVSWTEDVVLSALTDTVLVDSTDLTAGTLHRCEVRRPSVVDTLLTTPGGRLAAVRLRFEGGHDVTLVADGRLFSNARLRESDAGLAVVPMVAGRADRIVFDEYRHGFGPEGSLLAATLKWSGRSPAGWALWQLAGVAFFALLAGAIRFGPVRTLPDRRRRSSLEHVQALATALAAARGWRVAAELMVRGLRRRLTTRMPARGDVGPWLESLDHNLRTDRSRAAARTLRTLTRQAPDASSVLRAAQSVEEVWEDLKPPVPAK